MLIHFFPHMMDQLFLLLFIEATTKVCVHTNLSDTVRPAGAVYLGCFETPGAN